MARRERTTGLPRPQPRAKPVSTRRVAGLTWTPQRTHQAVLGAALAVLLIVVGVFAYRVYDDRIDRPNHTVLTVGDQKFSLGYYRDRLYSWLQENTENQVSPALAEQALLDKMQQEALTLAIGRDKGVSLSKDDITKAIAEDLGVTVDSPSFETLYRARLKTQHMTDSAYRRITEASQVSTKLLAAYKTELGNEGEQLTLRTVLSPSKEAAQAIFDRIQKGEDIVQIAQTESTDLDSRSKDGRLPPETRSLLPDALRQAVEGKAEGTLLGPVQVEESWWVFRIDKIGTEPYSEAQKTQLSQKMLDDAIAAKRTELGSKIDRSLSASDITWAEKNVR